VIRQCFQRFSLVLTVALGLFRPLGAQAPATLEGRVRDDERRALLAATVALFAPGDTAVAARPLRLAETDSLGAFRLEGVTPGSYRLRVTRLGHVAHEELLGLSAGERRFLEIELQRSPLALEGVTVGVGEARQRQRFEELAGATVREMTLEELKLVPGIIEADPIRAVEVLPGVVSTSDLSSSFHVRGGSADQNLILLDGVPVLSPFHLGGFFSVFNADMLDRAELSAGGFSARHGGRVSSVLLIESDPGEGRFGVDAGVSLLASRVAVGGGLPQGAKDGLGLLDARWRMSFRRSYADLLMKPVFNFPYHLTDLQGVFQGSTASGDLVSVGGYSGRDILDLNLDSDDFPLRLEWGWGNDAAGARWMRTRGGSVSELAMGATRFGSHLAFPDFADSRLRTGLDQLFTRFQVQRSLRAGLQVEGGSSLDRFSYDNLFESGGSVFAGGAGKGWLAGTYAQAEWSRPRAWIVEAGARLDVWMPDPGEREVELAPRVAIKRFLPGGEAALKLAAGRYTQFLHSLKDEDVPIGLDVWVLAGERAPVVRSDQVQGGVEWFPASGWFASAEAYHRAFDGVVAFNPADDPNDPLDDILRGRGTSWGADLFVRKDGGRWGGWLSASWLRARRAFPDMLAPPLPSGESAEISYAPVFDRRIDLDLVLRVPLPWGWDGGFRWNVATGTPFTRPLGSYAFFQPRFVDRGGTLTWAGADEDEKGNSETDLEEGFGGWAIALGPRNGERYPTYHRLDFTVRRTFQKSWGSLTPHVDIVNVYNRRNVLFYFYATHQDPPKRAGISMFPLLPTAGLEVRFR
jgi:hypothetical protein